jgi:hypothetical protein
MRINLDISENQLKIIHSSLQLYSNHLANYMKQCTEQQDYAKWANANVARVQVWDLVGQIFEQLDESMRP